MEKKKACGAHCIKISDINVRFGDEVILKDVNIHLHCGHLVALIGPNGAGKSTLIKSILGEVKHTGKVTFRNLVKGKAEKMKIGYVPQSLNIERDIPVTVYDLFASYISCYPVWLPKRKSLYEKIVRQLSIFSIEDCIDKQIGKLSGGELQRVLLSIAITPMPNLLILDEPVSGIDHNGVMDFYRLVDTIKRENDIAILLVSHDLDLVKEYADKVLLLNHEVICEGTPDEVYDDPRFHEIFDEEK